MDTFIFTRCSQTLKTAETQACEFWEMANLVVDLCLLLQFNVKLDRSCPECLASLFIFYTYAYLYVDAKLNVIPLKEFRCKNERS